MINQSLLLSFLEIMEHHSITMDMDEEEYVVMVVDEISSAMMLQ